jgi:opine dehydrogenase
VNAAREIGITTDFKIAEANSLTYGTRAFPDTAEVELSLEVKLLYLSAYPSKNTDVCLQACKQIYDYLVPASNIWEVLLRNGNPESHPGPCLLNAGRIEYSGDDFALYTQGITEHTVNIVESIQNERIALGKALGFELDTAAVARVKRGYFETSEGPLHKLFSESKVFSQITGPSSLTSRYFIEDISMGLVLWSDLGKALTVKTPIIDSVIHLGGALLKKDYYTDGLTLDKLGFEFADKEQLIFKVS